MAVLDLRIGGETAGAVAQRLAARKIPFMFYSGQSEAEVRTNWPDTRVLTKPAPPGDIVAAIAGLRDRS